MAEAKSQWSCKKCKGRFATMADHKHHDCVPKPFVRKPRAKKKPR